MANGRASHQEPVLAGDGYGMARVSDAGTLLIELLGQEISDLTLWGVHSQ